MCIHVHAHDACTRAILMCYSEGESPLVFDDDKVYLAMDWRNDPREKDSVVATPKATVVGRYACMYMYM